jgi:hypothetical protein
MSDLEPYFPPGELLADIRALIAEARRQSTVAVNMGLTLLYWRIGQRIHREVLGSERAAYGEQIVVTVSRQLVVDYGRGYSEKNLRRMVQFAEVFPEQEIVATLSRQLSWSHFSALLPSVSPSNGNSTRTWPGSKAGACVPFVRASTRCSMSAPRSRNNPMH